MTYTNNFFSSLMLSLTLLLLHHFMLLIFYLLFLSLGLVTVNYKDKGEFVLMEILLTYTKPA